MNKIDVLLGLQWGDEGKGKIVDTLTPEYDIITRFQGGPNAGHTLEFNGKKFILHTIPSGIFHDGKSNVIGNGVVLDPSVFKKEIDTLKKEVPDIAEKLCISSKAHLILPTHRILDTAYEKAKGSSKIGSTLKGIGPAYTDKTSRNGLRVGDILKENYKDLYDNHVKIHLDVLKNYDLEFSLSEYEEGWFEGIEEIQKFRIINSEYYINRQLSDNKRILAEGAQGTMLDIDFGSYPFVTSSNTVSAGACTGMGVSPRSIGEIFGIFKAYCTRVGSGPFPSEQENETGQKLRDQGFEYGSTTGRPRRTGWLDLPALKYSCMINGVTRLFMTKADVLSGFDKIRICTSYINNGEKTEEVPFDHNSIGEADYIEIKGWKEDISSIREYDKLPSSLKEYILIIEKETGLPVTIVSVGPDRDQTISRY
ncbi:MAG: adenylosuccinate synthase [Marinilabiliaceae bacterium]|jgi:adenylosuccinate synthase|nr:adenylosuccinate synthase [Marinilabiliaceae bacterium]